MFVPDRNVFGVLGDLEQLGEEWIDTRVDCNELTESVSGA